MEALLNTKLYIPPSRSALVARPRLIERLNASLPGKLTLVSAPAGFGKTTLVNEWIAGLSRRDPPLRAAWLSLDEGDSDLTRFLTYFIAALQTIAPQTGEASLAALRALQAAPGTAWLTGLLNEISAIAGDFVLVLDDYHSIEAQPGEAALSVDGALTFLLEHLPPQMHLAIVTREDPNLPLARLRARGQLTELRASDLQFDPAETGAFLNQVMKLALSEEEVSALEARTEGWIAGLQLAALALQGTTASRGSKDARAFIQSFTGSHHFVMDYLVAEVLEQQPESVQNFLLGTSILERLCGPLCDAVLRDPTAGGQAILEYLEQANLFLIPLDGERHWYRYHHLFADLLRKRLQQPARQRSAPAEGVAPDADELHRRASQWYEEEGLALEAFHHAAAAHDVERAARLIEGDGMPLYFRGAMAPVLSWLESLPTEALDTRPALWVTYVYVLTMVGKPARFIEEKLPAVEAALQRAAPDDETRDLRGRVAAIRAMLAVPQNQMETMISQSRLALELLRPDNLPVRTSATWTLGFACHLQGDRAAASQAYREAIAVSQASGNTMITLAATICLGQVQEAENQLPLAAETYRRALELAGDPPLSGACEAHLGLARVLYQWNELEAARRHGEQSLPLAQQLENVDTPAASLAILSQVKLAQGDAQAAGELLAQATQFLQDRHAPRRMPEVTGAQVAYLLQQGNREAAADLARAQDLPISQARAYLAQGDPSAALTVLAPLRREAEQHHWPDERLKVMALQALAFRAQGEPEQAVQALADALALAEPGGFVRIFLDEGAPMAVLLKEIAPGSTAAAYARRLLAAFGETPGKTLPSQPLSEPLSQRELEVLRLLQTYLSGPEIARELMVSLNTLRTHTKNIYNKLGVNNRQEAIHQAERLDLL